MNASSINPEAGHHPIPSDPAEIEAAIRAGTIVIKSKLSNAAAFHRGEAQS
jgi:hypothetical protein